MKRNFIICLSLAGLLLIACQNSENAKSTNLVSAPSSQTIAPGVVKVSNKRVCMINNKLMDKDQIPVPLGGKVYYGCCEGCVAALKNDSTQRFSVDMLTGQSVDKATAVIVKKTGTADEVLYFTSDANAIKYMQSNAAKP